MTSASSNPFSSKLNHLRAFIEICRLKSIRKAAETLSISQPSLTKMMQQLEHDMGAQLLERLPRGVEPTIFGETLLKHATFALNELGQAKEILQSMAKGWLGRVRIGANTTAVQILLPPIVNTILAKHPKVDIRVFEDSIENLMHLLRQGELDLVLAPTPRGGVDLELLSSPLLEDQLVVVARTHHDIFQSDPIDLARLLKFPWIFIGNDPIKESQLIPILHRHGLSAPNWVLETNSITFLMRFLLESSCVAFQSRRLADSYAHLGISIVPARNIRTDWPIMLSRRKNTVITAAMQAVIDEAGKLATTLNAPS